MTATPPKLIVFAGLPGAGKSTLAEGVARNLSAVWFQVDLLEASILKAGVAASFETGLAAYIGARDLAKVHLALGRDVVIDAVNGVEPARRLWVDLQRESGASRFVVEVSCSDPQEHRRRVESRPDTTPPLPLPTWDEVHGHEYEPWLEPVLYVDSARPVEENVTRILAYCAGSTRPSVRLDEKALEEQRIFGGE